MRNRIVTAVKQRFSIRKLSIGAASVLLGTSLYFMGGSATIVHADTIVSSKTGQTGNSQTDDKTNVQNPVDPVKVANETNKDGTIKNDDTTVNQAIDDYAKQEQTEQDKLGNKVIIRPSDKQPVTVNTADERAKQVKTIKDKIDTDIEQANKDNESIEKYKNDHPQTLNGRDSDFFKNQGLSIDDEKGSKINEVTITDTKDKTTDVDTPAIDGFHHNENITAIDGSSHHNIEIDGKKDAIVITHTKVWTDREKDMKINSDNKVIIDLNDKYQHKDITVTYSNLNNSYYLENMGNKTNRIKISRIERTFSNIQVDPTDIIFRSDGKTAKPNDSVYDECNGPQLIIYNDPSDGFFYNNIEQVSVKDIYYDDMGHKVSFKNGDKNEAWIFVTSLNSDGHHRGDGKTYIEKVKAEIKAENSDGTSADIEKPADIEKLAGSTVTGPVEGNAADTHHGWWYSDEDNGSYNGNGSYKDLAWDNNSEDNRYAFVGAVAIKYQPGLTITYGADDTAWGSHWVCTQTQPVSTLGERVIIYDHIKDSTYVIKSENKPITETITYKMSDGSKAPDKVEKQVEFNRVEKHDDVTNTDTWDEWQPNKPSFSAVPTPDVAGYTFDQAQIDSQTVTPDSKDLAFVVTYSPNMQLAHVKYIDDTTGKTLTQDDLVGRTNEHSDYHTTDRINEFKHQGYLYVSSTYPDDGLTFDNKDKQDQVFEVHLKEDQPSKGDETKPGKGDETKPGKGDETKPGKGDETKPGKGDETKPGKGDETKPGKGDETKPGKGDETKPGKGDETKPGKGDETKPGKGDETKPGKGDETKPGKGDETKPGKGDETKPGKGDETKPGKGDETKPGKGDETKPGKGDETKPGKGDETKPGKGDETKPGKGDETKPGKGDETKPGKGDETKPGKGDETKPGKGDETKPGKEGSKTPEKPIDSRTVDNHVSAKSTAKRELPQTSATINTGIWTGLVSMIASLGLLGASKKRKKN